MNPCRYEDPEIYVLSPCSYSCVWLIKPEIKILGIQELIESEFVESEIIEPKLLNYELVERTCQTWLWGQGFG